MMNRCCQEALRGTFGWRLIRPTKQIAKMIQSQLREALAFVLSSKPMTRQTKPVDSHASPSRAESTRPISRNPSPAVPTQH